MRKRNKNPVLQKKFKEGYEVGFQKGTEFAKEQIVNFFADRFDNLDKVEGIGTKTFEKIKNHFGKEYFERVDS